MKMCPRTSVTNNSVQLVKHPHITHPMREDVKKKHSSTALRGNPSAVTSIQARPPSQRGFCFITLDRRIIEQRCQSQLIPLTEWFHETVVLDALRLRSYASQALA